MSHSSPFSPQEMQGRLARIRSEMTARHLDAFIATNQANVRYATGFRGEPHTLLLTASDAVLYTSFRTLPWATEQTASLQTSLELSTQAPPLENIQQRLAGQSLTIGVEQGLSHSAFLKLSQQFAPHTLQPADPIEHTRREKSPAEISLLEASQRLNEEVFAAVIPQIQPGLSERAVQGLMLAEMAKREKIDGYSFNPIVAVDGNAWEIHHLPDNTRIQKDSMVLLDLGIVYQGYASDMTRTLCMGKATARMREVYDTVREAQDAAIALMQPGAQTHDIDQAAREVITRAGHARGFTHGLGHSIGLETHDPGLNLSPFTPNEVLTAGMAFTVEPGIYLENEFGVRTEDVLIIGNGNPKNITRQSKDLLELNF
ncbi:M24 family metallopeptidase [Roseibacillus persicicus]|uniref:M24 family metallopeptidase n=1 Tax=Roseibacillus persicicus TaxID=454148 RepID=UPI00280FC8FB|nr:Xaa-Pro peptidase family protein [Roseibacillus persicicus]MDQ8190264.1 Xaa-Pro peptidase family protein [Roseibacillus persicicus]